MDDNINQIDKKSNLKEKTSTENLQVGGQAVIEGVMMRSSRYVAVAVRKSNGEIVLKRDPFISLTKKHRFLNFPIIRGAIALVETLYIGIKALTFSADVLAQEEEENKEGSEEIEKEDQVKGVKERIFTVF